VVPEIKPVAITDSLSIGGGAPLALIAGPCAIESEAHCLSLAERLKRIAAERGFPFIFKASFDKANRTSLRSYRGPGLEKGLQILARVRREIGVPVLSDVHEPAQAAPAAEVLDILQIPAFLCRQTDLLLAAASTGRAVNVKKGQFLAPADARAIIEKVRSTGNPKIILTERGTTFGYHDLVVGIDALFVEVHDDPSRALSDATSALPLGRLGALLESIRAVDDAARKTTGAS